VSGLLVTAARVVAAAGVLAPGWLTVRDGRIAALGAGAPPPEAAEGLEHVAAAGHTVLPGFIDGHVHGGAGHETMDADPAGLDALSAFAARHGVTAFLPTTWSADGVATAAALDAVAQVVPERLTGARVLGAHMEGPYLNPARSGAQDRACIRPVDREEALRFLDTGVVRVLTLAPEAGAGLWLVAECARRGITASLGHTDAGIADIERAITAGARQLTHTFNAMRPLHHREPGAVGAALAFPELACELIADTVHVHPVAMRALHAAAGPGRLLLVTDAIRAAGRPDGAYALGGRTVQVAGGAVRLADGTLAGSVLTLDRALGNLAAATGEPLERLWPAASRTAAVSAGVGDRKGALAAGMDADLVAVDADLEVYLTVVEGRIVHQRKEPAHG
jgi:N-acetylglucosamine-6-phosphate deacetylase